LFEYGGFAHPPVALRRSRAADVRGKKTFGFQSVSARKAAGLGPREAAGLGPREAAGLGPREAAGLGPREAAGLGPRKAVGLGPKGSGFAGR